MVASQSHTGSEHRQPLLVLPPASELARLVADLNPTVPPRDVERFAISATSILSVLAAAMASEATPTEDLIGDFQPVIGEHGDLRPLEDWAGATESSGAMSKTLKVTPGTLQRWYHMGVVVGLQKGVRKRVYPLEQFVDGTPVRGLSDVLKVAGSGKAAWKWLITPNPRLQNCRPIDVLKGGRADVISALAKDHFRSR